MKTTKKIINLQNSIVIFIINTPINILERRKKKLQTSELNNSHFFFF